MPAPLTLIAEPLRFLLTSTNLGGSAGAGEPEAGNGEDRTGPDDGSTPVDTVAAYETPNSLKVIVRTVRMMIVGELLFRWLYKVA